MLYPLDNDNPRQSITHIHKSNDMLYRNMTLDPVTENPWKRPAEQR